MIDLRYSNDHYSCKYVTLYRDSFFKKIDPGGAVGGLLSFIVRAIGAIDPRRNIGGNSVVVEEITFKSFSWKDTAVEIDFRTSTKKKTKLTIKLEMKK